MAKSSAKDDGARPQPFLEIHFFDGGLRFRSFQRTGSRPTWAPPPDWVGFRNEFELSKNDAVIELARFKHDGVIATWLALHNFAEDLEFGDRQNYAGIGAWLPNSIVSSPTQLLETFQIFQRDLIEGSHAELEGNVEDFLGSGSLEDYTEHFETLPEGLGGLKPSSTPEVVTAQKEIFGDDPAVNQLVSDTIYLGQLISEDSQTSRLLVKLSGTLASGRAPQEPAIQKVTSQTFARAIARRVPSAFKNLVEEVESGKAEVADRDAEIEKLTSQKRKLENDLSTAKAATEAAVARANDFESALNDSEEHRIYVRLVDAVADVKKSVVTGNQLNIQSIQDMQGKIAPDLKKLGSINQRLSQLNQVTQPISGRTYSGYENNTSVIGGPFPRTGGRRIPRWAKWAFLAVTVLFLLIAIVWAVSRDSEGSEQEIPELDLPSSESIIIIPGGVRFECTPERLWDGDGPIWCKEGPRVRLSGVNARELNGTCQDDAPCPDMNGAVARDTLANLLGEVKGRSSKGHLMLDAATLDCEATGSASGQRTVARCKSSEHGDLVCKLLELRAVAKWDKHWGDQTCPNSA